MIEEIWKAVPGFKHLMVSNKGNVKTIDRTITDINGKEVFRKGKVKKQTMCTTGYKTIKYYEDNKLYNKKVHQLIVMAFLNHVPNGFEIVVDHIDNNPLNNNLENLQLITNRENSSKDRKNGTSKYIGVSWHKRSGKWETSIAIKGHCIKIGTFTDELEAANTYQKALANQDLVFRNKGRELKYRFYTDDIQPKLKDYKKVK